MSSTDSSSFPYSVSVFFPAFNDAPSLPILIEKSFQTLQRHVADFELIVVNDGSADSTAAVLERLSRAYAPRLRVVTHEKNLGYGMALRSGFDASTKDFVFYTGSDGQYDPRQLLDLLREVKPDVDLVNGYRTRRAGAWYRAAAGFAFNQFFRSLFRIRMRDIGCDFRLVRRSVVEQIALTCARGGVCIELARKAEMLSQRVVEVPVHHFARSHGRPHSLRARYLFTTFLQLCQLYERTILAPAMLGPVDRELARRGTSRER